ncbi:MAG: hypothetical protein P3W94_003990 [Paracoccus sp. (in: a-proteobacteria)]|nr:hypothetical protein [Paracoccus sp. (in: a-proteobacteria)]
MTPLRRAELWGPSGVGKTSIMACASELRQEGRWWWNADEIDQKIAPAGPTDEAAIQDERVIFDGFTPAELRDGCFEIVHRSTMLPSQKITALQMLKSTCVQSMRYRALDLPEICLHDELLIHRSIALLAYSTDFERDVVWYFQTVPVPDLVITVEADPQTIQARSLARARRINTYYGQNPDRQLMRIKRCLEMMAIGKPVLKTRGVEIFELDGTRPIEESAARLNKRLSP